MESHSPRLLGFTQSRFDPAARFRFIQLLPGLRAAGWTVVHRPNRPDRQWQSRLPGRWLRGGHYRLGRCLMKYRRYRDLADAGQFDVVFANRDLAGPGLWCEQRLLRCNPRVVYDFDDALFVGPNEAAVAWMCQRAVWVTPGNEYLARFARCYNDRVTVLPTIIDTEAYRPRQYEPLGSNQLLRVGWSGSDQSIGTTLAPRLPLLAHLQQQLPFELVIITNTQPRLAVPGLRWRFLPWRAEDEPRLGEFFDVGIMPLQDDPFQQGKCGLKLLQYMAAGLATIASPVGVNDSIVEHGFTGFKARTDAEWASSLELLIRQPRLCAELGRAGRERCVADYSVRRWLPVLLGIFEKVAAQRGRARAGALAPTA